MKFVFLLGIVVLCVLYMNAPVSNAKSPLYRRLQKRSDRSGEEAEIEKRSDRSGEEAEIENAEGNRNEELGELGARIDETRKKRSADGDQGQQNRVNPQEDESREEELGELEAGIDSNKDEGDRRKRAATDPNKINKWNAPDICYKFTDPTTKNKKKTINTRTYTLEELVKEAADEWNKKTGLNIHYNAQGSNKDCLIVQTTEPGCWAWIGNQTIVQNVINVEYPGCFDHGVILHEFGHALGLIHEAKRSDRDSCIEINKANIIKGTEKEFELDPEAQGFLSPAYPKLGEYDFCSIMHYSSTAFSSNGKPTITINENGKETTYDNNNSPCMGSQLGLSLRDGEGVAKFYGTLEENKDVNDICKHQGYLLKGSSKCICSNLFEGDTCEKPKTDSRCGGVIDLTTGTKEGNFATPGYEDKPKQNYPLNVKCTWIINSPPGTNVVVKFPEYQLEVVATDGTCAFDWFEVIVDELLTLKTKRYCGPGNGLEITADSNVAAVVFNSDSMQTAPGFSGIATYVGTPGETPNTPNEAKPETPNTNGDEMQYEPVETDEQTTKQNPQKLLKNQKTAKKKKPETPSLPDDMMDAGFAYV